MVNFSVGLDRSVPQPSQTGEGFGLDYRATEIHQYSSSFIHNPQGKIKNLLSRLLTGMGYKLSILKILVQNLVLTTPAVGWQD